MWVVVCVLGEREELWWCWAGASIKLQVYPWEGAVQGLSGFL